MIFHFEPFNVLQSVNQDVGEFLVPGLATIIITEETVNTSAVAPVETTYVIK